MCGCLRITPTEMQLMSILPTDNVIYISYIVAYGGVYAIYSRVGEDGKKCFHCQTGRLFFWLGTELF
uniref:Uncharacterized protein n=1 Tax=Ciona intestinalis TaxID=7719 RepID=H2XX62_CIOIN